MSLVKKIALALIPLTLVPSVRTLAQKLVPKEQEPPESSQCFTGVYNQWVDENNDNMASPDELKGLSWSDKISPSDKESKANAKCFGRSETVMYFMSRCPVHNPGGKAVTTVYAPNNQAVLRQVTELSTGKRQHAGFSIKTPEVYDEFGPGSYTAKTSINGDLESTINFNLVDDETSINPLICNFYKEFNNKEGVQREELIGLGKTKFKATERVTVALSTHWHKGETQEFKLLSPKGNEIFSSQATVGHNNNLYQISHSSHEVFVAREGYGTYTAIFSIGKKTRVISYEVTP